MAPAGRRRRWRQETLGRVSAVRTRSTVWWTVGFAEYVSSYMTERWRQSVGCGASHRTFLTQGRAFCIFVIFSWNDSVRFYLLMSDGRSPPKNPLSLL